MASLFKTFGKGILYVIGFPFFVLALVLFGAIGIFLFIFQILWSVICLFTGKKFFPELPEDKELRLQREKMYAVNNPVPEPPVNEAPQMDNNVNQMMEDEPPAFVEEPMYQSHDRGVEDACFNQPQKPFDLEPEPVKEEPVEKPIKEEQVNLVKEETIITSDPAPIVHEEKEEILEEYIPGGSSFEDVADDEEDTSNGVDIKYDL